MMRDGLWTRLTRLTRLDPIIWNWN
jgi:hypothetical protein